MKTPKNILCLGTLAVLTAINPVSAGTSLGIQIYPSTNITDSVGSVYSIQATTNLDQNNGWSTVAVVQLLNTNYVWFDTSFQTSPQRYYRTIAFTNTLTNMVFIPAGTFIMGSPTNEALRQINTTAYNNEVQHSVTISKGFFMGKYPVTQTNYLSVVGGSNPSFFNNPTNFNNPVEQVTWSNTLNYCAIRTAHEFAAGLIPTNWAYRLPTEAEWEYACRAGSTTAFYFGSNIRSGMADFVGTNEYDSAVGNILNTNGINLQSTTPVGSYSANGWGLFDMVGNVGQWCLDNELDYPTNSVTDPGLDVTPATHSTTTPVRGGSLSAPGSSCRSAARGPGNFRNGGYNYTYAGFRVVLAPTQ